jgi:hypothetical protein
MIDMGLRAQILSGRIFLSENRCPLFRKMLVRAGRLFFESPSRSTLLVEHDLFRPAFARRSIKPNDRPFQGFAQAGNRYPLFGIML